MLTTPNVSRLFLTHLSSFGWGSQALLDRLEPAAGNLLGQLGALSAEQTRKATILQGGQ